MHLHLQRLNVEGCHGVCVRELSSLFSEEKGTGDMGEGL